VNGLAVCHGRADDQAERGQRSQADNPAVHMTDPDIHPLP
jgi:hypothetical protein